MLFWSFSSSSVSSSSLVSLWRCAKKFVYRLSVAALVVTCTTFASVPPNYLPNYQISDAWQDVLDDFVQLESMRKLGQTPDRSLFSRLQSNFSLVFPNLPQDNTFKVTYQQCQNLAGVLSQSYSFQQFDLFMDQCYGPMNRLAKELTSSHTIKAKVTANPMSGPAPLSVTFDARGSTDPSNATIPSDNYFWWYKDIDGVDKVIGQGAVVNHVFEQEGNYIVNLTVRSANNQTQGILDGEARTTINVSPEAALLIVTANGIRMTENEIIKIGTQEAAQGVVLDGSATTPKGGRKILSHQWIVTNQNWQIFDSGVKQWLPRTETVPFADNGEYTITLTTTDNENNTMRKSYTLAVSDPIATILVSPDIRDTTTEVTFDAAKSYSIQSRIKRYDWQIFDDEGAEVYASQSVSFRQLLPKPWMYTVRLTVRDELGNSNTTTELINVESSPPQAQFFSEPVAQWEKPSQFLLDAGPTSDTDVSAWFDSLTYERTSSDPKNVLIEELTDDGRRVIVSFDRKGEYEVTLRAEDEFGQSTSISKSFRIESGLRPVIFATPQVAEWWTEMTFAVRSNKPIMSYQRNFGDNTTRTIQSHIISHSYEKVGVYRATLIATDDKGETNSISLPVFVGEKNSPIISYKVSDKRNEIVRQDNFCEEDGEQRPAYTINRYDEFTLDVSDSVGIKGTPQNLKYYFTVQDEDIIESTNFRYSFAVLWCRYIDVTLEDTDIGKFATTRVWFKVYNALPTLDNLSLFFPQYGNEVGIWFQQNEVKDIFTANRKDPLMVKVNAHQARDPDGVISTFVWYYYRKDDPNRILETKITPPTVPYAFFTITSPGANDIEWEYMFGVKMIDNDGWEINSEQIIGNGPVVFLPPDENKIDKPIVTLRADKVNVKAGDEITFEVIAKTVSNRPDFDAKKTIKFYPKSIQDPTNFLTIKDNTFVYVYEEANEDAGFVPKVEVTYRRETTNAAGDTIYVKEWLKPIVLYTTNDKTLLVRDDSIGKIATREFCFDVRECALGNERYITQGSQGTYVFEYEDYGKKITELTLTDVFGNTIVERVQVDVQPPINNRLFNLISLPQAIRENGQYSLSVWNSLNNSVYLFVDYNDPEGVCFVDTNILVDKDADGNASNDRELQCNQAYFIPFSPTTKEITARVYFEELQEDNTKKLISENFLITFLDYQEIDLATPQGAVAQRIQALITSVDQSHEPNIPLVNELIALQNNLNNPDDIAAGLMTIVDLRESTDVQLSEWQHEQLDGIIGELQDGTLIESLWWSPYDSAKEDILFLLPPELESQASPFFVWIDTTLANNGPGPESWSTITGNLTSVLDIASSVIVPDGVTPGDDEITQADFDLIRERVCDIIVYFTIPSPSCNPNPGDIPPLDLEEWQATEDVSSDSWGWSLLTVILVIVGVLVLIFVWMVVAFAVKARLQQQQEAAG